MNISKFYRYYIFADFQLSSECSRIVTPTSVPEEIGNNINSNIGKAKILIICLKICCGFGGFGYIR